MEFEHFRLWNVLRKQASANVASEVTFQGSGPSLSPLEPSSSTSIISSRTATAAWHIHTHDPESRHHGQVTTATRKERKKERKNMQARSPPHKSPARLDGPSFSAKHRGSLSRLWLPPAARCDWIKQKTHAESRESRAYVTWNGCKWPHVPLPHVFSALSTAVFLHCTVQPARAFHCSLDIVTRLRRCQGCWRSKGKTSEEDGGSERKATCLPNVTLPAEGRVTGDARVWMAVDSDGGGDEFCGGWYLCGVVSR